MHTLLPISEELMQVQSGQASIQLVSDTNPYWICLMNLSNSLTWMGFKDVFLLVSSKLFFLVREEKDLVIP